MVAKEAVAAAVEEAVKEVEEGTAEGVAEVAAAPRADTSPVGGQLATAPHRARARRWVPVEKRGSGEIIFPPWRS